MLVKFDIDNWLKKIAGSDDQLALRLLFDHFYPKLVNYAYYFLESRSAADEVISSVFVSIWNNLQDLLPYL